MKRRRRGLAALLLAGTLCTASAQPKPPPQPTAPQPAQIDRNGVLILVRTTLLALQQANETGNYTVLRDLASPGFREANTAARLAEIFASQRNTRLDLSGVAVLEPQLTLLPQIEGNGLLHMAGFFPSIPSQVNFELLFAPVDGRWRPAGIAVALGSSTPVAPPDGLAKSEPGKSEPAKPAPRQPQAAPRRSGAPPSKPDDPGDAQPQTR